MSGAWVKGNLDTTQVICLTGVRMISELLYYLCIIRRVLLCNLSFIHYQRDAHIIVPKKPLANLQPVQL